MAAMDFHAVKSCLACQIHRPPEVFGKSGKLITPQTPYKGGRVQVETRAGTNGYAAANFLVAHVAAMPQLNAGCGSFLVNAFGQFAQSRNDFRPHNQLSVKAQSAFLHCRVCYGGHAHTASCHTRVVVIQHLARFVSRTHAFKGCTANGAVSQCQGADVCLLEYSVLHVVLCLV